MLDHFEERQDIVLLLDRLRHGKPFNGLVQVLQPASLLEEWVLPSMSLRDVQNLAAGVNSRNAPRARQSRGTLCEDPAATANVEIAESG